MLTIEKQNATQQATLTDTATVSRQQPKLRHAKPISLGFCVMFRVARNLK